MPSENKHLCFAPSCSPSFCKHMQIVVFDRPISLRQSTQVKQQLGNQISHTVSPLLPVSNQLLNNLCIGKSEAYFIYFKLFTSTILQSRCDIGSVKNRSPMGMKLENADHRETLVEIRSLRRKLGNPKHTQR